LERLGGCIDRQGVGTAEVGRESGGSQGAWVVV
jgi:hypothetical protein